MSGEVLWLRFLNALANAALAQTSGSTFGFFTTAVAATATTSRISNGNIEVDFSMLPSITNGADYKEVFDITTLQRGNEGVT